MQALAERYGVAHGFTVPIHCPLNTSSCSVVPDSPRISARTYLAVELMAQHLFDRVARLQHRDAASDNIPYLSPRERQCLELAACGKSDAEIAALLGLHKTTAHNYIESAKKRLGLCNRIPAIVYALGTRQVRLEDVWRPLHRAVRQRRS
jgi:LuxR family quorum-sensing system transcriptional regulator CciR